MRLLCFIHCWSLDAPLVALAWQAFWDECLGVFPRWAPRLVLALTVWLIYMADRWLDGYRLSHLNPQTPCAPRHRMAITHRRLIGWLIAFTLVLTAVLSLFFLRWKILRLGLALSSLVSLYFLMRHVPRLQRRMPAREVCVGVLFAAGTCLPAFGWLPLWSPEMLWAAVLFGLLCALNCFAISSWEKEADRAQGDDSMALSFPGLSRHMTWLALMLGGLAGISLAFAAPALGPLFAVIGIGALLVGALDACSNRLSILQRRLLVDWALLLPAPVLVVRWLSI